MNKIKQLAGETLFYGLGNMVPRLLNFILFPLHTNFFAPAEYGVFTYLMSFVALLNVVYSFGMETAFFRFANKPGADARRVFCLAQTVVTTISLAISVLLVAGARFWAQGVDHPQAHKYILWLVAIMLIDSLVTIPFARLRLERKATRFAVFRIANIVVLTSLNLYFLFVAFDPEIGIGYIFLANLVANALYLIFFAKDLLSWRPVFDRQVSLSMLTYAYPIMLTGLAGMMNESFSRMLLQRWLPVNFYPGKSAAFALGVFGGCYKFAVLMNLAIQAFRMAAEPFFFSQAGSKQSPALFAKINHYFIICTCFILLAVSLNTDILKHIFLQQESYWEGLHIIPPLLLGYLFLGVYYNFTIWFKLTDRTYFGTIITVGGALLTVLLNYLLIPVAGYAGSSWASALVYGAMMVACYITGQRYYPIPYHVKAGLVYISLSFGLIYALKALPISGTIPTLLVNNGALIVFCAIVWVVERKKNPE